MDADFAGNWSFAHQDEAAVNVDTAKSRSGYVIMFANCPLIWASKLQTEVSLSTTEAEYVALSQALREAIPLVALLQEFKTFGVEIASDGSDICCTVFEDNSGALELAKTPKLRPRTKYFNVKYHHFRSHVENGTIRLVKVPTEEQLADILTKALPIERYLYLRKKVLGW